MGNCCGQGLNAMFGEKTAEHDLKRYRRRGPSYSRAAPPRA